jgi:hypothetical protein
MKNSSKKLELTDAPSVTAERNDTAATPLPMWDEAILESMVSATCLAFVGGLAIETHDFVAAS